MNVSHWISAWKTGIRHRPSVAWTYETRSLIWQIVPSVDGYLVGEERDPERREAWYFCVRSHAGEVLWERRTFGDGWWSGCEAITHGVLLLHGFLTPELPLHRKLIAVDVATGVLLWKNDSLTFLDTQGSVLRATSPGGEIHFLDARTGSVLTDHAVAPVPRAGEGVQFPRQLDRGMLGRQYGMFAGISALPAGCVGPVDLLEISGYLVLSYHTGQRHAAGDSRSLLHELVIISTTSGNVVFSDRLLSVAFAPAPDGFFLVDGLLYYIRERRMLTAVRFPHP